MPSWTSFKKGFDIFKKKPDEQQNQTQQQSQTQQSSLPSRVEKEKEKNPFENMMKSVLETGSNVIGKTLKINIADDEYLPAEIVEEDQAKLLKKVSTVQKTDELVFSELDARYYDPNFDPNTLVLASLPDEMDNETLEFEIMKNKTTNQSINQIIEENINKEITKNYNGFIDGVKLFSEFDLGIEKLRIATSNEKMKLSELYVNYIEKSVEIGGLIRRKMIYDKLHEEFTKINHFFDICDRIDKLIDGTGSGSMVNTIKEFHHLSRTLKYEILEERKLKINLRISEIESNLNRILMDQISSLFNGPQYTVLLKSFIEYEYYHSNMKNKFQNSSDEIKFDSKNFRDKIIETSHNIVDMSLINYIKLHVNNEEFAIVTDFVSLCKAIDSNQILPCLLDLLSSLTKILFNLTLILNYHKAPFNKESETFKGLYELSKVNDPYCDDLELEYEDIKYNLRDMIEISKYISSDLTNIWSIIQKGISEYLRSVNIDLSHFSLTNFFNLYHMLFYFMQFGKELGSSSRDIELALNSLSSKFFNQTNSEIFERFITFLKSENWKKLEMNPFDLEPSTIIERNTAYLIPPISDKLIDHLFENPTFDLLYQYDLIKPFQFAATAEENDGYNFDHNANDSMKNETKNNENDQEDDLNTDENQSDASNRTLIVTSAVYNGFGQALGNACQFIMVNPEVVDFILNNLETYFNVYVFVIMTSFLSDSSLKLLFTDNNIQKSFPFLKESLNKGYINIFNSKLEDGKIPRKLDLMNANDIGSNLTGLNYPAHYRLIAIESVYGIVKLLDFFTDTLNMSYSQERTSISTYTTVYENLKLLIYTESAKRISHTDKPNLISTIKFDISSLPQNPYEPISMMISSVKNVWASLEARVLVMEVPEYVAVEFWDIIIKHLIKSIFDEISLITKCTDLGIAYLLKLVNEIHRNIGNCHKFRDSNPYTFDSLTNYINGYYNRYPKDFITFIQSNEKLYSKQSIMNLLKLMSFKGKEKDDIVSRLEEIYPSSQ